MSTPAMQLATRVDELDTRLTSLERSGQLARSTVEIDGEAVSVPTALTAGVTAGKAIPGLDERLTAAAERVAEAVESAAAAQAAAEKAGSDGASAAAEAAEKAEDALAKAADAVANASAAVEAAKDASDLAGATITGERIAADTLTAREIAASAITAAELAADAVTAASIKAGEITASHIAAETITGEQLAAGSVATGHLAAGAVTAEKIEAGSVTADKLDADAINGQTITGATINGGVINGATLRASGSSGSPAVEVDMYGVKIAPTQGGASFGRLSSLATAVGAHFDVEGPAPVVPGAKQARVRMYGGANSSFKQATDLTVWGRTAFWDWLQVPELRSSATGEENLLDSIARYDVTPGQRGLPQKGVAKNNPPAGTRLIRKIKFETFQTTSQGLPPARRVFDTAFPNACLHITMTTTGSSGVSAVLNGGDVDRFGFTPIWVGAGSVNIQYTYEAVGW